MSEYELDARRLLCPMPVIKAQDKAKLCQPGDILKVLATDPGVKQDIPSWAQMYGHVILGIQEHQQTITVTIKIGSNA